MSEVKEHSVIYLSPSDDPEREWCQDDVWEESVRYNLGTDFDRVTAERDAALGREVALKEKLERWLDLDKARDARCDALQALLTAADEKIADFPTILFEHCNFQGLNSDGSPVFEFTGGFPNKIKSIRMIGWVCEGPRKAVELQVSFPALKP